MASMSGGVSTSFMESAERSDRIIVRQLDKKVSADLGSHVVANPGLACAKPHADEGGNTNASSELVRRETVLKVKQFPGSLNL